MKPEKILRATCPKGAQEELITAAGLNPQRWLVVHENDAYLYLVERHFERRQRCTIDKAEKSVVKSPGAWRAAWGKM